MSCYACAFRIGGWCSRRDDTAAGRCSDFVEDRRR